MFSFSSSTTFYDYVDDIFQKQAIAKLRKRIEAGESAYDILKISKEHKFYVDKICSGLIHLSYELYDRIMGCTKEDEL